MNSQNISNNMKPRSKGDRLNWTPLSEAKSVSLNETSLKGKRLSSNDLKSSNLISNREFVLVP